MCSATYEEQAAPPHLSHLIAAIWQIRGATIGCGERRILPDGCADFIFDLAVWQRAGGQCGSMVGPMTRALRVPGSVEMDMIGIRFRPGVVSAVVAVNADEMQDAVLPLQHIGVTLSVSSEQLYRSTGLRDRAALMMQGLVPHLSTRPPCNFSVLAAIQVWATAAHTARSLPSVAAVVRQVGVAERRLERMFATWVGYTPAQFRRLVRFRAAIETAQATRHSWAQLAMQCGYADQAHLTRDFRDFALTTPTAWAAEQNVVGFVQDGQVTAI